MPWGNKIRKYEMGRRLTLLEVVEAIEAGRWLWFYRKATHPEVVASTQFRGIRLCVEGSGIYEANVTEAWAKREHRRQQEELLDDASFPAIPF